VSDTELVERQYFWIDPREAIKIEKNFPSYAFPYIDIISTYISTIIDPTFLRESVIDNHVFFSAVGRESFGIPLFSGSADVAVTKSIESLNLEKLQQLLQNIALLPLNQHQWLNTISHWRLAALKEKDQWKRFLWSFLTLEILTHKLSDLLYDEVISKLVLSGNSCSEQETVHIPISELIWSKERLPLRAKFAIVALGLSPDSATADVENFINVKVARDKLSHGAIKDVTELPLSIVNSLLDKYLTCAVKFQLKV
jgi:hypothetical protein